MILRLLQAITGALIGVLAALVLVGMHRVSADIGGVSVPWGLLFGAVFMIVASVLLTAWFEAKLPLGMLAFVFALLALLFAGESPGGGVLMPAQIAGEKQWTGWAVQIIGVAIPLVAAGIVWVRQIRSLHRQSALGGAAGTAPGATAGPSTAQARTTSH